MRALAVVGAIGLAAATLAATAPRPVLLVVGSPHLGNPGLDMADARIEDVTTPKRQREFAALVDRLAAFRPNHVAVEWPATKQAKLDQLYADYRAGRHKLEADEVEQIGLRLAARLGLSRVDAIDWNGDSPGPDAAYDFEAWAKAHGRGPELKADIAQIQKDQDAYAARNRCRPVADWYREINSAAVSADNEKGYYRIATYGDATASPGADWVGAWHARNFKIYANLLRIAGKPGDRTLIVYGAGHGPLLRHFAAESGSFTVADLDRYLPPPAKPRCKG